MHCVHTFLCNNSTPGEYAHQSMQEGYDLETLIQALKLAYVNMELPVKIYTYVS